MSRLLTVTFTTAAFDRSSSQLFEASPYRVATKGPPSSFVQHDACAPSWHNLPHHRTCGIRRLRKVEPFAAGGSILFRHKGFAARQVSVSASPSSDPAKLSRSW